MWILMHAFFEVTFQPMNATLTFQIGLNDWQCAQAIRGKFRLTLQLNWSASISS